MRCSRVFLAATVTTMALAGPATAAQTTAVTTVNVVKPVSLAKLQDMDFGTLSFGDFTGDRTVILSRAGAISCAADIVCSGVGKQARFNLKGTNKMTVLLTYSGGVLSNGTDTIALSVDGPASLAVPNSGNQGLDFDVGGSLIVSSALVGGVYTGTMTVTADYQ